MSNQHPVRVSGTSAASLLIPGARPALASPQPICERRDSQRLMKDVAEVLWRSEARQIGHARRVEVGVGEKLLGPFEPQAAQILLERDAFAPDEQLGKVARREAGE